MVLVSTFSRCWQVIQPTRRRVIFQAAICWKWNRKNDEGWRFLAFQHPLEIPGVSNLDFLRVAYNSLRKAWFG